MDQKQYSSISVLSIAVENIQLLIRAL